MSQSIRSAGARAARRNRVSLKRPLPSTAGPGRSAFSEEPGLLPSQFKLLIDENLSPGLAQFARSRGFHAVHVNEINLRTAGDKHIARYAVDNGMILLTNNMAGFTRLYGRRALHPGLIFLQCNVKRIFTDRNQATMLSAVLEDLLQSDLVQEAISVTLIEDTGQGLIWKLTRYPLPKD